MTQSTAATPSTTPATWEGRTNALRKGLRTTLQVIVALAPSVLLLATGLLDPAQALALSSALTPVVAFAQNLLEDKGIIGTWLRRPSPTDTLSAVVTVASPAERAAVEEVYGPNHPAPFDQDGPRYRLVRRPKG